MPYSTFSRYEERPAQRHDKRQSDAPGEIAWPEDRKQWQERRTLRY